MAAIRRLLRLALPPAVCFALAWMAVRADPVFLRRADLAAFDLVHARADPPPPPVPVMAVIATDQGIGELGHWPLPRAMQAQLLGKLGLARTVAVDFLFPERTGADDDALLAAAVREMGNVVLAMHISVDARRRSVPVMPYPELGAAAAGLGFTNVRPEVDGIFRDAFLFWGDDERFIPSLPLAAWMHASGRQPAVAALPDGGFAVDFPDYRVVTGPDAVFRVHHPREPIPIYEYADVYSGRVPPETFRDAVVFVGASAAGTDDFFPTGPGGQIAGVLYNAHAARTLFTGWLPVRAAPWARVAFAGLLASAALAAAARVRTHYGWVCLAGLVALHLAATAALYFGKGVWMPPSIPGLLCVGAFVASVWVQLHRLTQRMRVQRYSVDSQLALGRAGADPADVPLADYLAAAWADIERWSGLSLVVPLAADDDPEVLACLDRLPSPAGEEDDGAQVAVLRAPERIGNRLLLIHPLWDGEERCYTVLSWKGRKTDDDLRSVAALLFSAALRHRALAEGRARRELFLGVIRLIMRAVDAKDPTTAGHSERVAFLARELAEKLALSKKEVEDIYLSGLLHDVGKIGIPDRILNFPGRLSDEDMEIMRRHPSLGSDMLGRIKLPAAVLTGILEHHERMDGRGYPAGLGADGMSLAGRILKVADVYDALRSKRQYKDPLPQQVVYDILRAGAGDEFDPAIIDAVLAAPFTDLYGGGSCDTSIWKIVP